MKKNGTRKWFKVFPAFASVLLPAFGVGCADFGGYRGGATVQEHRGPTYQPTLAQGSTLPSVQTARMQTGISYRDGMAKLQSWNATEREREINAYLARHPEFKNATRQARIDLKTALVRWDAELANRRDLVTRIGGSLSADGRYVQLLQGRAKTQSRLDEIDASLVTAMLEESAGAAARSMSWTEDKARALDAVAKNAAAAESAERGKTDAAFGSAIF